MSENTTRSLRPQSAGNKHYASTCPGCGTNTLAKAGSFCPHCKQPLQQREEFTRKTFQGDDLDLKKAF